MGSAGHCAHGNYNAGDDCRVDTVVNAWFMSIENIHDDSFNDSRKFVKRMTDRWLIDDWVIGKARVRHDAIFQIILISSETGRNQCAHFALFLTKYFIRLWFSAVIKTFQSLNRFLRRQFSTSSKILSLWLTWNFR